MPYEKAFTDTMGGIQRIRTIGSSVLIDGPGLTGQPVSCAFNAADFRSANIDSGFGRAEVQVAFETTGCWFGGKRGVAFELEDILEAANVAKAEA